MARSLWKSRRAPGARDFASDAIPELTNFVQDPRQISRHANTSARHGRARFSTGSPCSEIVKDSGFNDHDDFFAP